LRKAKDEIPKKLFAVQIILPDRYMPVKWNKSFAGVSKANDTKPIIWLEFFWVCLRDKAIR
jgi:hypothetical protein